MTSFFDLLNSRHVAFLKEASRFGDLYVGVGSDSTFEELKGRKPICSEQERLYMVKAVRHVKDAFINSGSGMLDFLDKLDRVRPDIFVVNTDNELKQKLCEECGIEFVCLETQRGGGAEDAEVRNCEADTAKPVLSKLPYRIDIAGTWIDQPYVSEHGAGWAITASIEPTHEFMERGGMSTSTRNAAKRI